MVLDTLHLSFRDAVSGEVPAVRSISQRVSPQAMVVSGPKLFN
jgi:hypothetical protein